MDFRLYRLWTLLPFLFFSLIAALIVAPLFAPGYVFLLDMVWGPGMTLGDSLRNGIGPGLPIFALHRALDLILPNDLLQKILLAFVLFLPGASMFHLARRYIPLPLAVGSGLFSMLNPFVYERFLAGQWVVLLGYGFLPIVLSAGLNFYETPRRKEFVRFLILFGIFPFISLHFSYISVFILLTLGGVFIWKKQSPWRAILFSRLVIIRALIFLGTLLILHSFWLFGFFNSAKPFSSFGESDFQTFATRPHDTEHALGVFGSALSLYGFWDNDFFTNRDIVPGWWVVSCLVFLLSSLGAFHGIRQKNPLVITLVILFIPTLLLAIGFGSPFTRPITEWCLDFLPFFRGLRDTAKLLGILACSFALFLPGGILVIFSFLKGQLPHISFLQNSIRNTAISTVALALLSGGTLLWGAWGQLTSTSYPSDWQIAETILREDPTTASVLALPWKGYLELDFADRAYTANPSNAFFVFPVITSRDTGNRLLGASGKSAWDETITSLLEGEMAQKKGLLSLRKHGISHIILLKTDDWKPYQRLADSPEIHLLLDSDSIAIYSFSKK